METDIISGDLYHGRTHRGVTSIVPVGKAKTVLKIGDIVNDAKKAEKALDIAKAAEKATKEAAEKATKEAAEKAAKEAAEKAAREQAERVAKEQAAKSAKEAQKQVAQSTAKVVDNTPTPPGSVKQGAGKPGTNVPYKKDGGFNSAAESIGDHGSKHAYNPTTVSTKNKTQYGKDIDIGALVRDTMKKPDSMTKKIDPRGNHWANIYKKNYRGNISTPDTPTGQHRVIENLLNRTKSSNFPHVPRGRGPVFSSGASWTSMY